MQQTYTASIEERTRGSVRECIAQLFGSKSARRSKSVRCGTSPMWWGECCGGRAKTWDALGRDTMQFQQIRDIPIGCDGHVIVPLLPRSAYRMLMEFLRFDYAFCHFVVPVFTAGGVMLYVIAKKAEEAAASGRGIPRLRS